MRRLGILMVFEKSLAQCIPLEDVDSHRSEVAVRFLRFFGELHDIALIISCHDAESAGVFPWHLDYRYGKVGSVVLVLLQHKVVVHLVDMVARKDKNVLRLIHIDEVYVVVDGVCSALIPLSAGLAGVRRQYMYTAVCYSHIPRLARSDVSVEDERFVLDQYAHCVDPGVYAVRKSEIDDPVLASE